MEVWSHTGHLIGIVRESISLRNELIVENANNEIIYRIHGDNTCSFCFPKETHFLVMSADAWTQKGTISRTWDTYSSNYVLNIYFVNPLTNVHNKALLLSAGFLIEYKYFLKHV